MATFPKIKITSNDGSVRVEGDLVLDTSTAWQVATNGRVRSYLKTEFTQMPQRGFEDLFGSMFGGGL